MDASDVHYTCPELAVSLDEVQNNLRKYELLNKQSVFERMIQDALFASVEQLATLHLDRDVSESTGHAHTCSYPKLCRRGFCLVDDRNVRGCQAAIQDFHERSAVCEEVIEVGDWGLYWQQQ